MQTNKIPLIYKGKYGLWRMIYILIVAGLVSGALFTYYFIYQNIYFTLANANIIIALKSNALYELDIKAFESAAKFIAPKEKEIIIPKNLRNIFSYSTTAATTTIDHATSTKQ